MEGVNKSFEVDNMFTDDENVFEKYESEQKDGKGLISIVVKVLSGLTNILKKTDPKKPDSKVVNRVSSFLTRNIIAEEMVHYGACLYEKRIAKP